MQATALESIHVALGARMVPFGGWNMPVQYRAILDEARTVRTKAGLFDLGHMGRVKVSGRQAEAFLQKVQTNDAASIAPGRIKYAMLLSEQGLTQDDILVYRNPQNSSQPNDGFFVVVNAGNTDRDLAILQNTAKGFDVLVENCTHSLGMIAIQGPASEKITQRFTKGDLKSLKYYAWMETEVCGMPMTLSRTGYTGEDGFEVYVPKGHEQTIWNAFFEFGAPEGMTAIGLGARDTLRLEAGMPLYGHEIDLQHNPIEAGLSFGISFKEEKGDWIGRSALERVKANPTRTLVGLATDGKRAPREGYGLFDGDDEVGRVCSGAVSPTLGKNIGTGYLPVDLAARLKQSGGTIDMDLRGKRQACNVVDLPFYSRTRK